MKVNINRKQSMRKTTPFAQRVKAFWSWFLENETTLQGIIDNFGNIGYQQSDFAFIKGGIDLLGGGLMFSLRENNEFAFTIDGIKERFFLLPYITANAPEQLLERWKIYPCVQSAGGAPLLFEAPGTKPVNNHEVMVSAVKSDNDKCASLRFYAEAWRTLKDNERKAMFFIFMANTIGEELAYHCVGDIAWANAPEQGMIPLAQLERWMLDTLLEGGHIPNQLTFSIYSQSAEDDSLLRHDVHIGTQRCMSLISGYGDGDDTYYNSFTAHGAKPVFLYWKHNGQDTAMDECKALVDLLKSKVLGVSGTGSEIGTYLGDASGTRYNYIDLLLYDEKEFIEKVRAVCADMPQRFYYKEFRSCGKEYAL